MPDLAGVYSLEDLERDAQMFHVKLEVGQLERLRKYARLLAEWNERVNLTAITDPSEIYVKHFADSLALCALPGFMEYGRTLLDVGSGAGFPGLVIKIARPEMRVVLCDALAKRIRFLRTAIRELGLEDTQVWHGRAEELAKPGSIHRDAYPIVTARAVAALPVLAEWCLPFVAKGGHFIAMKGPGGHVEAEQASPSIRALSGRTEDVREYRLPRGAGERTLVVIVKEAPTPRSFPRRPGEASRNPVTAGK
jgi:16S rRNA (guanine527-N7)-methyltransferase